MATHPTITDPDHLRHLVLHFTKGQDWIHGNVPNYVRGQGCYIWDDSGRRFLDGLAGLFVVQIGHGRSDIAQAAARQMEELAYTPTWGAVHPPAIEASKLISSLAPGDLDAIFFVSSGSEAVESAIKFSRQYHKNRGDLKKTKCISRETSYHGTTMGALSLTGLENIRTPFEPLLPGFIKVPNTHGQVDGVAAAQVFEDAILAAGPETVAMVTAEPVQNSGGCLVPPTGYWQELRRICDKYGVLLHADEVINSFGRLGTWFGADFVGVVPDMITFAKGATSGYAPIGGLIVRRPLVEDIMSAESGTFTHGATWGGHPVVMAVAVANITAMRDEGILENVQEHKGYYMSQLKGLMDAHDIVGDVRGTGYLHALELVKSRAAGVILTEDETTKVVGHVMPDLIRQAGLLIRADDRGVAKLTLSPPLIAKTKEIDELVAGLDQVLSKTAEVLSA